MDTKLTAAPESASIASLDESQLKALCEQLAEQNATLLSRYDQSLCTMAGLSAAVLQSQLLQSRVTDAELRDTCLTTRDECLDDPDDQLEVQDCDSIGFVASMVTTTVGELNACRSSVAEFYAELGDWLPSCEGDLEAFAEQRATQEQSAFEACETAFEGFPDALDCSGGVDALDPDWICDGVQDCAGGEDEADC